jgi:hypothetical protein
MQTVGRLLWTRVSNHWFPKRQKILWPAERYQLLSTDSALWCCLLATDTEDYGRAIWTPSGRFVLRISEKLANEVSVLVSTHSIFHKRIAVFQCTIVSTANHDFNVSKRQNI